MNQKLIEWVVIFSTIIISLVMFLHKNSNSSGVSAFSDYQMNFGNREMKSVLKELNDQSTFPQNPILSDQGILFIQKMLAEATTANDSAKALFWLAQFNLRSGHAYKSIEIYAALKKLMEDNHIQQVTDKDGDDEHIEINDITREIAMAWLRNSEQLNCQLGQSASSCIYPFSGSGVHLLADDAKESRVLLMQLLEKNSKDHVSRWLLNISNSAIGYPEDSIPAAYRINMNKYEAPITFKPFNNIAIDAGVSAPGLAGGAATEDFNNDGLMDIVVSSCGLYNPLRIFFNKGDGSFEEKSIDAGLEGITGGLNLTTCDYNNDGWIDIFLMRGGWMEGCGNFPNSLLKNNGNGTFTDVTYRAGLFSLHPTHSSVWVDFNHDGWLDVFVAHETSDYSDPHYSEFYINNKNGTFTECGAKAGLRVSHYIKGVAFTDINNDGWADLYLSVSEGENVLFKNNGPDKNNIPRFTDVTAHAGVAQPAYSFPVFSADINNDGWEDLFVGGYMPMNLLDVIGGYLGNESASHPYVYINQKNGTYRDESSKYNLHRSVQAMGINFGDIDNDGYPDIYLGTGNPDFKSLFPNVLLHNVNGKYFADITLQTRTGDLQKGHGVAFCDIDDDGDEDIYEDVGGFYKSDIGNNVLFENPGSGNNYIGLLLEGCKSDRSCVGARVEVIIIENGIQRHIYKTVNTGGSFGTKCHRQLIGIGKASTVQEINIYYPATGIKQKFKKADINKYYLINECSDILTELKSRIAANAQAGLLRF